MFLLFSYLMTRYRVRNLGRNILKACAGSTMTIVGVLLGLYGHYIPCIVNLIIGTVLILSISDNIEIVEEGGGGDSR